MRHETPLSTLAVLLLMLPAGAILLVLFGIPLFWIFIGSLGAGDPASGWDMSLWLDVLTDPVKRLGLAMSLYYSVTPVLLALPLAIGIATQLQRQFSSRAWFLALFKLPIAAPGTVVAFVMLALFDQGGFVSRVLATDPPRLVRDTLGIGVILTLMAKELPFITLLTSAALAAIPDELLHASRSLGANRWSVLWHIQLPLAGPGISAALLLSFIKLLGTYAVPQLLGPVFPVPLSVLMVAAARQGHWNEVCAIGMAITFVSFSILYVYATLTKETGAHRGKVLP